MRKVYNLNNKEPKDYKERHTVRFVIFDDTKKNILLFDNFLPGGGVEEGESDEETLVREALEELGAELSVLRSLGEIVAYRDEKKIKYINRVYLCKYERKISEPTTTSPDELGVVAEWSDIEETINRLEKEIQDVIDKGSKYFGADSFEVNLHMRQVHLDFIKEAFK